MSKGWRLLDTGLLPAADNMALDAVLLDGVNNGESPNTLRFERFSSTCVLVGYNQNVDDEVDLDYCRDHGIDVNRRISGGGTILMEPSILGWELVARKEVLPGWGSVDTIYRVLCQGCVLALQQLGVKAQFRPHNDIEVNGKKISGTGGVELGDAFLFHGTVLVDLDLERMVNALRTPAAKLADKGISSLQERLTWLGRELEQVPAIQKIIAALVDGFKEVLAVDFWAGELNAWEKQELKRRLPWYSSYGWIYNRSRKPQRGMGSAIYKAPGGLIRVDLSLDRKREIITSVLITGDFFAHPSRLVADLEAALKDCPLRNGELRQRVEQFFARGDYRSPGVSALDFIAAVEAAVDSCRKGDA